MSYYLESAVTKPSQLEVGEAWSPHPRLPLRVLNRMRAHWISQSNNYERPEQ